MQCAVTSAEQVKEVEVRRWAVAAKQALVGTKPAATTGAQLPGADPAALAKGRVKLTFPWLSDTYVSDWARTVQFGAGKDRGATIVPEVGDEVLVSFEKEGIVLASGDGKVKVELDLTGTKITVHSDGTVLVEAKNGVVVDAGTGKLELKGQEITMKAKTGVTVEAGTALVMKGATAKLEGSGQTELKAAGVCTISGSLVKINGMT